MDGSEVTKMGRVRKEKKGEERTKRLEALLSSKKWWREKKEWRESVDDVDTGKKMKKKKKRRVWGWRGG